MSPFPSGTATTACPPTRRDGGPIAARQPRNNSLWQFDEACEKRARGGRVEPGVGVGRTAPRVAMACDGHDPQRVVDELRATGVTEALTAFAGRIDVDVEHEPARAQ